jgi:hypothetical protein
LSGESENNNESIMKWFDQEVQDGENGIVIYPNLQTFHQIYTQYVKEQLSKTGEVEGGEDDNNSKGNEQSNPRIILIATFYETTESVKHHLSAVGVDAQSHIEDGSLVIVDAFSSYYPDVSGMKKLVASLSERARREGRVGGVTAIVDMGFFFLFGGDGRATELINYEASLAPKIEGGNVKGFSCYHGGNYNTLKDSQKEELAQKGKKVFDITESAS